MPDTPADMSVDNTVKRVASSKFELDNRISINTVIACLTLLGGVFALTDRLSSNAATIAVIQNKQVVVELNLSALVAQRYTDRQEILTELKDIKSEIRDSNRPQRK